MSKSDAKARNVFKQIHDETVARYKQELKDGVVIVSLWDWDKPDDTDFKVFGNNGRLYMKSIRREFVSAGELDGELLINMFIAPDSFKFVPNAELERFETVTYPKLYANWLAKRKRRTAENRNKRAGDPEKLRAKIAKLQQQLDELEA